MEISLEAILDLLNEEQYLFKDNGIKSVSEATALTDSSPASITWLKPGKEQGVDANTLNAGLVICDGESFELLKAAKSSFLIVKEPKRIFSKLVTKLFVKIPDPEIHPTAFIHPEAKIGRNCYIGPFSYIGKCVIGNHNIIYGNCHFYDGVKTGDNVTVHAGTVIGSDGFGYSKDEQGNVEKFPHIGGVIIGSNVEIGANTCIDRGALSNTIIGDGAKIDNLVHIAHNVVIGETAFLIANAMIGGSTVIEKGAWIAPSASLLQQLRIGQNATVGVGAVVTKNVPDNETWTGAPARPIQEFIAIQKNLKEGLK